MDWTRRQAIAATLWLVAEIVRDASLDTTFNIRISTVSTVQHEQNCVNCNKRHNIMCAVLNLLKHAHLAI